MTLINWRILSTKDFYLHVWVLVWKKLMIQWRKNQLVMSYRVHRWYANKTVINIWWPVYESFQHATISMLSFYRIRLLLKVKKICKGYMIAYFGKSNIFHRIISKLYWLPSPNCYIIIERKFDANMFTYFFTYEKIDKYYDVKVKSF